MRRESGRPTRLFSFSLSAAWGGKKKEQGLREEAEFFSGKILVDRVRILEKVSLFAVFLGVLTMGVLGALNFYVQLNSVREYHQEELANEAIRVARVIGDRMENAKTFLRFMASHEDWSFTRAAGPAEVLAEARSGLSFAEELLLADEHGRVLASASSDAPASIAERPYFQQGMSSDEHVSDVMTSVVNRAPVMFVTRQTNLAGGAPGLLVAVLRMDRLQQGLLAMMPEADEFRVVNEQGRVVLASPGEEAASDMVRSDHFEHTLAGYGGSGLQGSYLAEDAYLYAFGPVEGLDWGVMVTRPARRLFAEAFNQTFWPLVTFGGILAVVALISWYVIRVFRAHEAQLLAANQYLHRLSFTDSVTGLPNHRHFQELLRQRLSVEDRLAVLLFDIDNFRHYNERLGHEAGDEVLRQVGCILKELLPGGMVCRYGQDQLAVILPGCAGGEAVDQARRARDEVADYPFSGREEQPGGRITVAAGIALFPRDGRKPELLVKMAEQALDQAQTSGSGGLELYFSVFDEIKESFDGTEQEVLSSIKTLVGVINSKDRYTYGHTERVVRYAVALAEALRLPEERINDLRVGAYLHDIGKIEIDRRILVKAGPLLDEELAQIKQHPRVGADILKPVRMLHKMAPIILYHHERFDGRGYPEGLKGENIPLAARIVALADSFDAMTTNRPYKRAISWEEARREIRAAAGSQFDPTLAEVFSRLPLRKRQAG